MLLRSISQNRASIAETVRNLPSTSDLIRIYLTFSPLGFLPAISKVFPHDVAIDFFDVSSGGVHIDVNTS
jgi:hypothetical protein